VPRKHASNNFLLVLERLHLEETGLSSKSDLGVRVEAQLIRHIQRSFRDLRSLSIQTLFFPMNRICTDCSGQGSMLRMNIAVHVICVAGRTYILLKICFNGQSRLMDMHDMQNSEVDDNCLHRARLMTPASTAFKESKALREPTLKLVIFLHGDISVVPFPEVSFSAT